MKAELTITFEVEDQYDICEVQGEIENALYSIDCKVGNAYIISEED